MAACVISVLCFADPSGRSLTSTLEELQSELQNSCVKRAEIQQMFSEDYDRQHQRMIDVIRETNELSLLLYTQEQRRTFDMSFALKKVTTGYKDFNQGKHPYDQITSGLSFEIERYARLIEALRRLPPEMRDLEFEALPDSLLYRNDSLDSHLAHGVSSLETEIIRIATTDTVVAPFVLDEAGEQYRDTCILYASELLRMFAGHRDSVVADSTHYQEAYLRTKEAYDYAVERYAELDRYVFHEGQIPYWEILGDLRNYWHKVLREQHNQYDFVALDRATATDKDFMYKLSGRSEKAFAVVACWAQTSALLMVWIVLFVVLWLLIRYTKVKDYIPQKALPLVAILAGTIMYFLIFGYFWKGSEYVRSGVKNINTFLWLLIAISGSLLLRVRPEQLRHGVRLYVPTFLLAVVVIICRNMFVPDILLNFVFTPVMLVAVIAQLIVCLREQGRATRTDSILGWVSLGIYCATFLTALLSYVFAALIYLVWWYFLLTALLAVFCISDLLSRYKESRLEPKIAALRKHTTYAQGDDAETMLLRVTWLHDLVKQVVIPTLLLLALPWATQMALDMFDFTDLYSRFYSEPFIQLTDDATGVSTLRISAISIVYLAILFFVMRYLSRVIHAVWQHTQYAAFMRKHKRTTVRPNEINLSLGNSIINVIVWATYAVVVIVQWKIPTGSLGLIAGGLSAGIGIALKDILNNFIYGIQLMGGRLRVGDWIECDGIRGKVTAINYQCVQVETTMGTEMSFLNAALFNKNFNNLTRNNSYEFTKIIVGVAYGSDIPTVREVIMAAMQPLCTKDHYGRDIVDQQKGIRVVVDNMSDSAVDIAVKQSVLVAERAGYIDRAKEAIYDALNAAGISIPFPQCDVHIVKDE